MKSNINSRIYGLIAAAAVLFAPSCVKDTTADWLPSDDEVSVTFTLAAEGSASTRSVNYPDEEGVHHISDGSQADMLIYAVYAAGDEDLGTSDELLTTYGLGVDKKFDGKGIVAGTGQTVLAVDDGFPVRINFRFTKGRKYKLAFWAQNSNCKAYNAQNLRKVEVRYSELNNTDGDGSDDWYSGTTTPNNDETRDAFCRVYEFEAKTDGLTESIYLYRPFAQVNVGTSGFDFETIVAGKNSKKYVYSRIEMGDVARYLDVVADEVLRSTTGADVADDATAAEARATVDYLYARFPAYLNDWAESSTEIKADPAMTLKNEEYLCVDLNGDGTITPYMSKEQYDALSAEEKKSEEPLTETFKYLSMCYVLAPSKSDNNAVLDNLHVYIASDEDHTDETEIVALENVPIRRNWRTNIVSQSLLSYETTMTVNLSPMYSGDFIDENATNNFDGPLNPYHGGGAYYDAEADEILISNVNGLLWLQRMVNGKYEYPVYVDKMGDGNYVIETWNDEGIVDPTTVEGFGSLPKEEQESRQLLKARIMRATKQEWNINTGGKVATGGAKWPQNNNFHFTYCTNETNSGDQKFTSRITSELVLAKVRLTADINLAGLEWIPIGWANNTAEVYDVFREDKERFVAFCGEFNGDGHVIYNIRNKRFGVNVAEAAEQKNNFINLDGNLITDGGRGPYYKAVQWFPVGLFGQIAQSGRVINLHVQNVDLEGCCHVGGIAGIVTGVDAFISNCSVDGGSIVANPMYRGDSHRQVKKDQVEAAGRTFARGIFAGGIVGYLNIGRRGTGDNMPEWENDDRYGALTDCDVRNVTIYAYRQSGGLVGGMNINHKTDYDSSQKTLTNAGSSRSLRWVRRCNVSNVTIISDKFQPYNVFFNTKWYKVDSNNYTEDHFYRNGFGWSEAYTALAHTFIGGESFGTDEKKNQYSTFTGGTVGEDYDTLLSKFGENNTATNITITEFATGVTPERPYRHAEIRDVPLEMLPLLSSYVSDTVRLASNFNGNHSAYTGYHIHTFAINSEKQSEVYKMPYNLPFDLKPDWDLSKPNAGVFVESLVLSGSATDSGHSVITVNDAKADGACVMYVASRDRSDFYDQDERIKQDDKGYYADYVTAVDNVVLRGNPYAYAGLILAPKRYTAQVIFDNISIYDVYKTVEQKSGDDVDPSNTELIFKDANLRGFTNVGGNWKSVSYTNTVFGAGATTGHDIELERTCQVDKTDEGSTFTGCWFKAPYNIVFGDNVSKVKFENSYAVSATDAKIALEYKTGCKRIEIRDDGFGNVTVEYDPAE